MPNGPPQPARSQHFVNRCVGKGPDRSGECFSRGARLLGLQRGTVVFEADCCMCSVHVMGARLVTRAYGDRPPYDYSAPPAPAPGPSPQPGPGPTPGPPPPDSTEQCWYDCSGEPIPCYRPPMPVACDDPRCNIGPCTTGGDRTGGGGGTSAGGPPPALRGRSGFVRG